MQDGIIKGTGNSRYLKSISNFLTQYPTYQDFVAALVAGTLPIDLNGINPTGWDLLGTALNTANLLSNETGGLLGLGPDAVPDKAFRIIPPIGSVFWLASPTIPDGYLLCDGSAVSRTDYAALFAAIGTTFGAGDGSTTFALPDLRAAFIRGAGSNNGYSATFGAKQDATYLTWTHQNASGKEGVNGLSNLDKSSLLSSNTSGRYSEGPIANSTVYYYYLRPYNFALTPIIKY